MRSFLTTRELTTGKPLRGCVMHFVKHTVVVVIVCVLQVGLAWLGSLGRIFHSTYSYETTIVEGSIVKPVETKMQFRTERKLPKLGVMLVGLGGNNGWYVLLSRASSCTSNPRCESSRLSYFEPCTNTHTHH